jgi:hypothetical protein
MHPLIVSFFTKDWEYPEHGRRLKKECADLGLDSHIVELKSTGSYIKNCCMKPFFLRTCLQTFNRPVLWIDVDGSILKKPDFFLDTEWDFQAKRMGPHRKRIYHVGTIWINNTPKALEFVDKWCEKTGDMTDESSLDQTLKSQEWDFRHRDIPPEYFVIAKRPSPEAVIFHRISSGQSKQQETDLFNKYEEEIG